MIKVLITTLMMMMVMMMMNDDDNGGGDDDGDDDNCHEVVVVFCVQCVLQMLAVAHTEATTSTEHHKCCQRTEHSSGPAWQYPCYVP